MKRIINEFYNSIKYIIPIIFVFLGIILLKYHNNILTFTNTNLSIIRGLLTPFFIGFIIAYILNTPMKFIEKKFKIKRGISIAIIYGTLATIFVFVWLYILPIMQSNIEDLYNYIPKGIAQIERLISQIPPKATGNLDKAEIEMQINDYINTTVIPFLTHVANVVSQLILSIMTGVISYAVNIFLGLVISIYLLLSKEKILEIVNDLGEILLGRYYFRTKRFINILDRNIGVYIIAKTVDSTIYGTLCTLLLYLVGSKYPLFLGLTIGITNMIPFFGPIIGTIIVTIVNIFFSFKKGLVVLAVLVVAQQLESAILEPYFVGRSVGVPAILTILVVTFAGKYSGFFGMILSVPITGVLLIYIREFIAKNKPLKQ